MFVTTGAATVFGRICDQVKNVSERTRFSSRIVKKLIGDQLGDQQASLDSNCILELTQRLVIGLRIGFRWRMVKDTKGG